MAVFLAYCKCLHKRRQNPRSFSVNLCFPTQHHPSLWDVGVIRDHFRIGMGSNTSKPGRRTAFGRFMHTPKSKGISLFLWFPSYLKVSGGFFSSLRIQPGLKCKHRKKAGVPFQRTLLTEYSTVDEGVVVRKVCSLQRLSWRQTPVGNR